MFLKKLECLSWRVVVEGAMIVFSEFSMDFVDVMFKISFGKMM